MNYTRRELSLLAPVLLAALGESQTAELPSQAHPFDQLPMKRNGENKSWSVLNGMTHAGCPLEVHITNLAPGGMPHPPHNHVHEEMFLVELGTVEVTIAGKATRLGPNSVAFVHSNEKHGIRNVGDTHAQYFVVAIGSEKA
jgi:mannose-6-phosphate isomerase-like protein (cupin superfamily)